MTLDLAAAMRAMARTALARMMVAADQQTAMIIGATALEMLAALPEAPPPDPPPPRDAEAPPSTQPAGADAAAESPEDPQQPAQGGAGPAAQPAAKGDDAPPGDASAAPSGRKPGKWTAARRALLRDALWFALPPLTEGQMLAALNALPADLPVSHGQVTPYAITTLGLPARRKPEWRAEAERRQAAAAAPAGASRDTPAESDAGQKPQPAPPTIPAGQHGAGDDSPSAPQAPMEEQPPACAPQARYPAGDGARASAAPEAVAGASGATPRARRSIDGSDLPAQHPDEAEAKQMLRDGSTVRQVSQEFGLPMATVSLWQLQVRKEAKETA